MSFEYVNQVICGDALDVLQKIPDCCVDLVVIDPPYFRVKSCWWDNQWNNSENYLIWLSKIFCELKRISKLNSSLYCFASSAMACKVESLISDYFNVLNHVVWRKNNDPGHDGWKQKCSKESLRKWYSYSERVIFAENMVFPILLREARCKAGLTAKELAEMIGAYGSVNHGGSVSNWETGRNIPTVEQYDKLIQILDLPPMDEIIRPFHVNSKVQYTDVWDFNTVKQYKGKHPCEKPKDMIKHIIEASSVEDNLVLDCFCGSGVVLEVAKNLNRKYVGVEIESEWVEKCKRRLSGD